MTNRDDQSAWLPCPCCSWGAVPPCSLATEDEVSADVALGDPLWSEDQIARCPNPECGCMVSVSIDEIATPSLLCESDEATILACPCVECRQAVAEGFRP